MGLFFSAHIWNIYLVPVLLYFAQLCRPPQAVSMAVDEVMLRTWSGPFNTVSPADLKHLQQLGFPIQFKDLTTIAKAAQFRVAHWDSYQSGGLQPQRRVERLQALTESSTGRGRYIARMDWNRQHGLLTLANNMNDIRRELRLTPMHLENSCAKNEPRPWPREVLMRVKQSYQKAITTRLQDQEPYDAEAFIRRKLEKCGIRDRREASRALQRFRSLGGQVPPRLWASSFAMLANRWATQQNRGTLNSRCLLGCGAGPDACWHYGECGMVWDFARKSLDLTSKFSTGRLGRCMAAPPDADSTCSRDYWSRLSLCHYAVMRATNALRLEPPTCDPRERGSRVWRSLRAGMAEGVRNSPLATLLQRIHTTSTPTAAVKRSREEEVADALLAPPSQRRLRLISLM